MIIYATYNRKAFKNVFSVLLSFILFFTYVFSSLSLFNYYNIPNTNEVLNPGNISFKINDTLISKGMYNYYRTCIINNYYNYSEKGYYNLKKGKPLEKQYFIDADGNKISWLDKIDTETKEQIQYVTCFYEEAIKDNKGKEPDITEEQKENKKEQINQLKSNAETANQSLEEYIVSTYGNYCGLKTIEKVLNQNYIANNYYQKFRINLSISEKEINKYFSEHKKEYLKVPIAFLQCDYNANNKKEKTKLLNDIVSKIHTENDLKKYIKTLCKDIIDNYIKEGYFKNTTDCVEALSSNISTVQKYDKNTFTEEALKWLFENNEYVGECNYFDDVANSSFYIILKLDKPSLQMEEMYSIRHILVENKDTADNIITKYNNTEKTEYDFANLAEKYSTDLETITAGNNGIYGGIYSGLKKGTMISQIEKWALDPSRKYGDIVLIKSDYGYHIIFFLDKEYEYQFQCKKVLRDKIEKKLVLSYKIIE